MRQAIYWTSVLIVFVALIAGTDNYFGPEIKKFSTIVFWVWVVQVITGNLNGIKLFMKDLYGLDKK